MYITFLRINSRSEIRVQHDAINGLAIQPAKASLILLIGSVVCGRTLWREAKSSISRSQGDQSGPETLRAAK